MSRIILVGDVSSMSLLRAHLITEATRHGIAVEIATKSVKSLMDALIEDIKVEDHIREIMPPAAIEPAFDFKETAYERSHRNEPFWRRFDKKHRRKRQR